MWSLKIHHNDPHCFMQRQMTFNNNWYCYQLLVWNPTGILQPVGCFSRLKTTCNLHNCLLISLSSRTVPMGDWRHAALQGQWDGISRSMDWNMLRKLLAWAMQTYIWLQRSLTWLLVSAGCVIVHIYLLWVTLYSLVWKMSYRRVSLSEIILVILPSDLMRAVVPVDSAESLSTNKKVEK